MKEFLKKQELQADTFELLIDANLFTADIVMRAAYNFLDRGNFFFSLDANRDIILQCNRKDGVTEPTEQIVRDYSDELLSTHLRATLERDNRTIRETIVRAALTNSLDTRHFVSLDTDSRGTQGGEAVNNNRIDFDKDIDEILREIENDPDLKIDEAEIERILKEIEAETKPVITDPVLDPKKVENAKKKFSSGK